MYVPVYLVKGEKMITFINIFTARIRRMGKVMFSVCSHLGGGGGQSSWGGVSPAGGEGVSPAGGWVSRQGRGSAGGGVGGVSQQGGGVGVSQDRTTE